MAKGPRQQPIPRPKHQAPPANNAWDDLNELSNQAGALLSSSIGEVRTMASNAELTAAIGDREKLMQNLQVFRKDSERLTGQLTQLKGLHQDRSGNANNPDELMHALNVGARYQELVGDIQNTLLPSAARLSELYLDAASDREPVPSNTEA